MKKQLPESSHKQRLKIVEIKKHDLYDPRVAKEPQPRTSEKEWEAMNEAYKDQREMRH